MRRLSLAVILFALSLITAGNLLAADAAGLTRVDSAKGKTIEKSELLWYDLRELVVEGRGFTETKSFYDRLPAKAEGVVRSPVWNLSLNSAGIATRFVTDAKSISARWKLRSANLAMPHMPATGASGLDLYIKDDKGWHWLANGRPGALENQQVLASSVPAGTHEYFLYLPLYNGVQSVEIGVPSSATLYQAAPRKTKPIVFYGTSITQGGCASRPGMCYSAILGRWLDHEAINLGFSGNAKMEPEVAKLLAELDPSVYFLNALPNMNAAEITERAEPFVRTIRQAHPNTPIVLVEDRTYANSNVVAAQRQRNDTSRAAFKKAYENLMKEGVKGLSYVEGEGQIGDDGEGTVDGSHPTDLGFYRQATFYKPVLVKALAGGK